MTAVAARSPAAHQSRLLTVPMVGLMPMPVDEATGGRQMPMDRGLYPPDWEDLSKRVREEAGQRCEWCGAENGKPHPRTGSRVVLTVAHLDAMLADGTMVSRHDKSHQHREALAALCQACHLGYDREDHIRHAAETQRRRKIEAGQLLINLEAAP